MIISFSDLVKTRVHGDNQLGFDMCDSLDRLMAEVTSR